MIRAPLATLELAALVAMGPVCLLQATAEGPTTYRIDISGGTEDDAAFVRAALGILPGQSLDEASLNVGIEAVRATDRFRTVDVEFTPKATGNVVLLKVDPWPRIQGWSWKGDIPSKLAKSLLPELRKGQGIGDIRLEQWRERAELRLRDSGYPEASVRFQRTKENRWIDWEAILGRPTIIRRVEISGDRSAYADQKLIGLVRVQVDKTLWTQELRKSILYRLRKRFLKDKRYQWRADLALREDGTLQVQVNPGPVVRLAKEGSGLGFTSLKEMVPLARAERYSPELLSEGERRIIRLLRSKGYLDAQVSHRREVTRGSAESPEEVRITYLIEPGERTALDGIRFERNQEIQDEELRKVADLPARFLIVGKPLATPELLNIVEDRIKGHYLARGFPDVVLRRRIDRKEGRATLMFTIREGARRNLKSLSMEMPSQGWGDGWNLAECLSAILGERVVLGAGSNEAQRRYQCQRPGFEDLIATIDKTALPTTGGLVFRLSTNRPLPFIKSDLAQVFSILRQRIASQGALRPQERLRIDQSDEGAEIVITVPDQPRAKVQRLVVRGCEKTRSRAVLRETSLEAGAPMDPERLARAQARVGNLGAFQRVDLLGLSEVGSPGSVKPWKEGDLLLRLEEREPWVISSSFGYDKSQGYHTGLGVQRLNVAGMGRTLDFGIRAGDGTIQNPTLRRIFPTGEFDRSVDSYGIGYTDPWFSPGLLDRWLPDRAQFRLEAAYIQERRSAYLIRKRRLPAMLEWRANAQVMVQAGYRFERVDVKGAIEGINDEELSIVARTPGRSIISAPFAQLTRDTRDNPFDPTRGAYGLARVEFANQFFGTSPNSSFVKLDLRQQWNWSLGYKATWGVVSFAARLGVARPTESSTQQLPLSERFFAGGPFSHRGVEPDSLGPQGSVSLHNSDGTQVLKKLPLGGQALALVNLEYRFPIFRQVLWGEIFADSGQVYLTLKTEPGTEHFPPFRTALGVGLIWKLGIPIKIEYAADWKRLRGQPRTQQEKDTQLKGILLSAGFQF